MAEVKEFFQMWLNFLNQKGQQPGSAGLDQVNSFQKKSGDRRRDEKQQRLSSLLPLRKLLWKLQTMKYALSAPGALSDADPPQVQPPEENRAQPDSSFPPGETLGREPTKEGLEFWPAEAEIIINGRFTTKLVAICYAVRKMNLTSQDNQLAWELLIVLAK